MWYLYIILIFIVLLLFIKLYIKIKYPFWSIQPVYHIYDFIGYFKLDKIINNNTPSINKYVNIINIKTYDISDLNSKQIDKICDFIRNNFIRINNYIEYIPENHNIIEYLKSSNHPSYVNIYKQPCYTKNCEEEYYSVMTARPLNVTLNNNSFLIYYIDNLCVIEAMRKKNIANKSIQTFYYNGSHLYPKIQVHLFKREGKLTAIVPLTIFNIKAFNISNIFTVNLPHSMYKVVEISSSNLNMFTNFINLKKQSLQCIILPDLTNLINNIKANNLSLYGILSNNTLISIYVFRDCATYYENQKTGELLCSLENCDTNLFVAGFTHALKLFCKKIKAYKVIMDETSSNIIVCNYLSKVNIKPFLITNGAFYLYNYRCKTITPSKCFICA
tara:strand:- start:920 stop:2083 length:1164 start_codon:yes stop_codon:yes gene_type:complete